MKKWAWMYGNPEVTTGGRALKYYASVRIDIRRVEGLKDSSGQFIGNHTRAKIVKNKVLRRSVRPSSISCSVRASPR